MGFTSPEQSYLRSASEELRALWSMAAPITAMNILVFLRAMISVLCLGRLGRLELAGGAMSIGFTNITGYSVLFGLASALEPICSQAFGSQNLPLVSLSFQRTILLLLVSSLPISLLWLNITPILCTLLKQDPEITAIAATFCFYSLPDLVTNSFLQPLRVYLRSQGITKPLMWCSAVAVLLHIPLNLLFVFVFEMGVAGVAIAQVATNMNMVVFLLGYLYFSRVCEKSWTGWSREAFTEMTPLVKLAVPSCLGVCLEWWWYEIVTLLAGYLPNPKLAVAATAILIQTTSFMYTFPMALGACVSTRVSLSLSVCMYVCMYVCEYVSISLSLLNISLDEYIAVSLFLTPISLSLTVFHFSYLFLPNILCVYLSPHHLSVSIYLPTSLSLPTRPI